ncbi:MAG: chloramphenicol phosphotransferase [Rhodospirillales bacterium]|nr:chloramphenicol phosphotransferase [Rhodospirillales bacterium]
MRPRVIVLNGGSSAGKSSLVRALQGTLPEPWVAFGVDSLVEAMPPSMLEGKDGLAIAADGSITVGPAYRAIARAWRAGIGAMARAGANVILDVVFLDGAADQAEWRGPLRALPVFWVGVRCAPAIAAAREAARGDRVSGMAARQAETVHRGVAYDVEVDTSSATSEACARAIAARLGADGSPRRLRFPRPSSLDRPKRRSVPR